MTGARPGPFDEAFAAEAERRNRSGLERRLALPAPEAVDLVTNDYLGLSRHPEVIEAARSAATAYGTGARASRLLGGGSPLDAEVEREVAAWLGAPAALLFPSGYQANLGLLTSVLASGDVVVSDALNHASIIDAVRLSGARILVYRHADADHARALLAAVPDARRRVVVTEGIFSMDGDRAPLDALARACREHDAALVVDEAHAVGVVGPEGAGTWADVRDAPDPSPLLARVVTGGKALGVGGALVVGSRALVDHLVARARSFMYTTGAAPPVSGALLAAARLARRDDAGRERIRELARRLATALALPVPDAGVIPGVVGDAGETVRLAEALEARGYCVRAVRPPTVPDGSARLRVTIHATHSEGEIDRLADALHDRVRPVPPPTSVTPASRPLVVVGTDTSVGKTVVAALLVRAAARSGRVRYWKPVQTGSDDDTAEVRRLAGDGRVTYGTPAYHFPLPASPHEAAADAGDAIVWDELLRGTAEVSSGDDAEHLIVELAGGLLVPYDDTHVQADWLAHERPAIVLVARSGLGTLNHTLLTLEALRARRLDPRALFLVGPPHASNRATLEARARVPAIFEVPVLEELTPSALDAWLDENDPTHALQSPHPGEGP